MRVLSLPSPWPARPRSLLLPVAAACLLAACGGGSGGGGLSFAPVATATGTTGAPGATTGTGGGTTTGTGTAAGGGATAGAGASTGTSAGGGTTAGTGSTTGAGTTPGTGCPETGVDAAYACKTGATESLYTFQWALNYAASFFKDFPAVFGGGFDLDVEAVHTAGIKGQGVNVLVLDDGVDIANEDLAPNVDRSMTWNYDTGTSDPTPPSSITDAAHGTNAAGIIAAAQNGKGVMGVAPRVTLGGARFLASSNTQTATDAYGGANWSRNAWIINASYGANPAAPPEFTENGDDTTALRTLRGLRGGKGIVFVKATGNEFDGVDGAKGPARACPPGFKGLYSCENPAHDVETLEPSAIAVASVNAKGVRASYSSAGAVNWVSGLGGESGEAGTYGEGDGPTMFSTDLRGCSLGYSRAGASTGFLAGTSARNGVKDNANCDYSYMNGTSAATPTVAGVVALVLQANPALTWRDVRDILRLSARRIDTGYGSRDSRNVRVDLAANATTTVAGSGADIADGATRVPLDLGWQQNATGQWYSSWYGFGLVDAAAAVKLAQAYAQDPSRSKPATQAIPAFGTIGSLDSFSYGQVKLLGSFTAGAQTVDQLQVRLSGPLCVGSVGIVVKSPASTLSYLSIPYNIYYNSGNAAINRYALGSYAFYGESGAGTWQVYAVSGTPTGCAAYAGGASTVSAANPLQVEARIIAQ